MTAPAAFRTRLRRYPALGFLAVAALLASLLPSALRVPLSGPTASAELAPVPGKSDAQQGDLSALGQTSTGGLGAGRGLGSGLGGAGRSRPGDTGSAADPPPDGGGGGGRNPANKRCVGNPPRQTEDPMSPACVRFFKGDNGGATSKGVTRDEIRVVFYTTACGNITIRDVGDEADAWDRTLNRYARFFNERFQTYDRKVRFYSAGGDVACRDDADRRATVQAIDRQVEPFYLFRITSFGDVQRDEAARLGIVTSGGMMTRAFAREHAPYAISYVIDLEGMAASVAAAVCARVAGRPARFHGDPSVWQTRRKLGLLYEPAGDWDRAGLGGRLLLRELSERCPAETGEVVVGVVGDATDQEKVQAFVRMRLEGVTTVLAADDTPHVFGDPAGYQGEYFNFDPWIEGQQLATYSGPSAARYFGLMGSRRAGGVASAYHRQALGDCAPSECIAGLIPLYDEFLLLFTGIQAAGPRLTAQSMDRGLRALPAHQSTSPFEAAAYFGPGDHSFVKDYSFVWWDPTGIPPGGARPGCWRLVEDGRRYRAEDWAAGPQGDTGVQQRTPEQPCQGI